MADVDRTDAARHVLRAGSRGDWIPRSTEGTRADDGETAIRRDLMDHFLHDAKLRLIVNKASMLTLVAICWNHADRTLLLGWLTLGLVHFTAMLVLETPYYRRKTPDTSEAQQRMLRTLAPLYVAGGLLWGMPPLFYFMMNSMPRTLETACGMIVVSMAAAPITNLALVPTLMRCFTHSLFCMLIACLFYRTIAQYGHAPEAFYFFLVIPFIHWALMMWLSTAVYRRHRKMCTLQHELAAKEKEARHAIETKNRLLAAATHDVRQPVAALSLFAALLVKFPHMHTELAPKIAMATDAINHLFDSLFQHSALESDAVSVTPQDVDLGVLLSDLHAQFETVALAKRIRLRVRNLQAVVRTDPVHLRRIIGNILANAIDYSTPDTRILLAGRMHQGELCVQVWDQGMGIEPCEIDKIFQEFYRVDAQHAPPDTRDEAHIDGIGLGLSIVARLSQLLHIRVEVKSAVNQGTRFTLRLPTVAPA